MTKHMTEVADTLDISAGYASMALDTAKGRKRDAIHLANWPDTAFSLRSAIDRLPKRHATALRKTGVRWIEADRASDLNLAIVTARIAVLAAQLYLKEYSEGGEAWDVLAAAVQDALVSVKDLKAAAGK